MLIRDPLEGGIRYMELSITLPIIVLDDDDVLVFESRELAEAGLEAEDVRHGLIEAYGADGRFLAIEVRSEISNSMLGDTERVIVSATDCMEDERLAMRLRRIAVLSGLIALRDAELTALPQLVRLFRASSA